MNEPATTQYRSMLLRFSRDPATSAWRITLRDVDTPRQLTFATLDELFAYLSLAIDVKEIQPYPCRPLREQRGG